MRAAFLLLLAGCSVVNDPDRHRQDGTLDAGVPRLEPSDACAEVVSVLCAGYDGCCAMKTLTREQCEERGVTSCTQNVERYIHDPRTGYDPVRGAQLLAEARELTMRCDPRIAALFTYDLPTALQGTNPRGDVCISLAQVGMGDFAGLFSCRRADDLVCRPVGGPLGDWTCQGSSAEGGACNHLIHCERGLYCDGNLALNGRCTPQLGIGAACTDGAQCQSLSCVMGTCQAVDADVYCSDVLMAADMRM